MPTTKPPRWFVLYWSQGRRNYLRRCVINEREHILEFTQDRDQAKPMKLRAAKAMLDKLAGTQPKHITNIYETERR